MGTIRPRKRKDNTTAYCAQIRINRDGQSVYQETQTFDRKQVAQAWMKRREAELAVPGAIERISRQSFSIKQMIDRYLDEYEKIRPLGKTKRATLKAIGESWLGEVSDSALTSQKLVEYAQWRMSGEGGSVQPQTVGNDLSHLGAVLSVARPAWGYDVSPIAMSDARIVLRKLGMVSKSKERIRRPTKDELDILLQHFFDMQKRKPTSIHMPKIIGFAIFSTRRQEKITRIRWSDLDEKRQAVLVRDMKNPGQKIGNDVWCHLPDEAWSIVQSMPKNRKEIFPYNSDSISAAFTRACKLLALPDLRFHDLRHDGVSRLFEMNWDIPRVSSVSGHRDWNSLRRYTHLRGHGDPYEGWEWLQRIMDAKVHLGNRIKTRD
ncbi:MULTISPECIES: tyrosine-type recombinase/integrase [Pseudomonas syringae group]|uniref:Chorismate mutase n=2 Tax=Pseudomonas syringae group TaxID=136849 RepID=A0A2K4WX96_PSESX|nr:MULTISPECIES: tyrosine-type recombinase/integrase [Pseudomonas syringae group]AVB14266.1 integrase [Pseudomonas amygdali pv. morsprunorum]KWS53628.1 integrase [Pseudomonas amygdali pv. morsprunorum]KWS60547.1 integrase [Pseudomonas amygdali pv. morsprunorum]MBI6731676.1 tyrosine-type recombinase/integrase [Pseudomonas amygdali]MBI6812477.1 tyrosine-type recombinase/integrase [Pseudomonas amygdali]